MPMDFEPTMSEEVERDMSVFKAFFDKVDERLRQRYFTDPVVWNIFLAFDVDDYILFGGYAAYCLACEIEQQRPMSMNEFKEGGCHEDTEFIERVYKVILPGEVIP